MATANSAENAGPPQPGGGWSNQIVTLENAVVFPPETSSLVQACGVVDRQGDYCQTGATWRGHRMLTVPDETPPKAKTKLAGRHLYAGQIWAHFGHFMAESLPRLWALDHLNGKPDSIVFIPKRPQHAQQALKPYQSEFLKLLQIDIPVTILTEPTKVEELVVPGQGFGLGDIALGTPEFRDFMGHRFATGIPADGPEKLYVSRSRLGGMEGGAILEERLEDNLREHGYGILHPQEMTLAEQVARYRAAKQVLGLDGSAFHLFGFVAGPSQRAGIILRRDSGVFGSIRAQIQSFCGIEPVVYDAIAADWIPEHKNRPGRYSFGEIDFEALAGMLHETGFGPEISAWNMPRFRDMKREMMRFSSEKGVVFHRRKKRGRSILSGHAKAAE